MRKALFAGSALLTFCSLLPAGEPWKSKPVGEWTQEETLQFLRGSPWVRPVTTGSGSRGSGPSLVSRSPFDGVSLSGDACLSCAHVEPVRQEPRVEGSGTSVGAGETTYFVQWTSARVVRQGHAHLRAVQGQGAEEPEPLPLDVYVLTVSGSNLQVFEGVEEPQLRATAYLRAEKSRAKVAATRVSVLRGTEGRIGSVHFGFPRELDGQPAISEKETSVEFVCRSRDVTIKASFDLTKMVVQQTRDL